MAFEGQQAPRPEGAAMHASGTDLATAALAGGVALAVFTGVQIRWLRRRRLGRDILAARAAAKRLGLDRPTRRLLEEVARAGGVAPGAVLLSDAALLAAARGYIEAKPHPAKRGRLLRVLEQRGIQSSGLSAAPTPLRTPARAHGR